MNNYDIDLYIAESFTKLNNQPSSVFKRKYAISVMIRNQTPTKILYVINSLGSGGAERQLMYLIEGLDREEYDPVVLTLYDESAAVPYFFQRQLEAMGISVYSLGLSREANPITRFINAVRKYVTFHRSHRPAIVQGCLHFPNLIVRAGRLFTPRHILITMAQEGRYTPRRLKIERFTAFLSDVIVANSARSQKRLIDDGKVNKDKVIYINCGVEYQQFEVNPDPELRAREFPDVSFAMVMVARIAPNKDHPTLLKALAKLKQSAELPEDFRLILVGMVSHPQAQAEIDHLLDQNNLRSLVVQLPPTDTIAPYFHLADVLVLPSKGESFGLVVVEGFAAGKPYIVSEEANVLGIVREGETGWVFPTGDADSLAEKIKLALNADRATLTQMGENAAKEASSFSVDLMVEGWLKLYERLSTRK